MIRKGILKICLASVCLGNDQIDLRQCVMNVFIHKFIVESDNNSIFFSFCHVHESCPFCRLLQYRYEPVFFELYESIAGCGQLYRIIVPLCRCCPQPAYTKWTPPLTHGRLREVSLFFSRRHRALPATARSAGCVNRSGSCHRRAALLFAFHFRGP